ncbi:MAG: STAS domain-containing protein [Burkholderiales bacterium]|nr:STAS domain-containing protein [Burkholderiales bacterium]
MIRAEGERIVLEGPLNLSTVPALVGQGAALIRAGASVVDLAAATEIDSSAVALVLEWARESERLGRALRVVNAPDAVDKLADLYGVSELLPLDRR